MCLLYLHGWSNGCGPPLFLLKWKTMISLENEIENLENSFGKNLIHKTPKILVKNSALTTHILPIDEYFPIKQGTIVEIYGKESSYKTTLCLNLIKNINSSILYIDTDKCFSIDYAEKNGIKDLLIYQPKDVYELFSTIIKLYNKLDIIIIDSLSAVLVKNDDYYYATKELKKLKKLIKQSGQTIIYTKQVKAFRNKDKLNSIPDQVLDVYKDLNIVYENDLIGEKFKIKTKYKEIILDMKINSGIWYTSMHLTHAIEKGVVTKKGNWYYYKGISLANGYYNCVYKLEENADIYKELIEDISG